VKTFLKIFAAVVCISAVMAISIRHHAPAAASAQPVKTIQTAPTIIKDRETQLEAMKALQDRFLARGIDATVKMYDATDCEISLKEINATNRKLHLPKATDIHCEKEPVQATIIYALASKVFAYQLAHDKNFLESLHQLGFTRVVLVNPVARKHWMWFGTEKDGFSTEWSEDSY